MTLAPDADFAAIYVTLAPLVQILPLFTLLQPLWCSFCRYLLDSSPSGAVFVAIYVTLAPPVPILPPFTCARNSPRLTHRH